MRKGVFILLASLLASLAAGAPLSLLASVWTDGTAASSINLDQAVAKRIEAVHKIRVKSELTSPTGTALDEAGFVAKRIEAVHKIRVKSELTSGASSVLDEAGSAFAA